MYDPEKAIEIERLMGEMVKSTKFLRERLGESNPLVALCVGFDCIFAKICNLKEERDNCFDIEERDRMSDLIHSMLKNLMDKWLQVESMIK